MSKVILQSLCHPVTYPLDPTQLTLDNPLAEAIRQRFCQARLNLFQLQALGVHPVISKREQAAHYNRYQGQ